MNDEIRYLDSLQGRGIRPGLGRVRRLLDVAGNPEQCAPSVIVAGTNGKGSSAATLSSILRASGYRSGLYISPHLVDFRERWLLDDRPVSMPVLRRGIRLLRDAADRSGISPTYFEALTVLAFLVFRDTQREVVVLETGLGGRLDATNVTRPLVALISPIGIDHVEFLGLTTETIASEKAGVIHPGCVALTNNSDQAVLAVLRSRSEQCRVPFHVISEETSVRKPRLEDAGLRFRLRTPSDSYAIETPLTGLHQIENVSLAVRGAEELRPHFPAISSQSIERGVRETRWRGRLERFVLEGRRIWVDGAHNAHAAGRIGEFIDAAIPAPRLLVFGIMADKDVDSVTSILFPRFDEILLTEPDPVRTASTAQLRETATRLGVPSRIVSDPRRAIAQSLKGSCERIVVCGSLYLAGAAVDSLDRRLRAADRARRSI